MIGLIKQLEDGKLLFQVEKALYHHQAILSAAHEFTDICYIHVASIDSNFYGVYFTPKKSGVDLSSQINEFCNELIDQQLRLNLDNSNKSIKELIIKKAFFPFQDNGQ